MSLRFLLLLFIYTSFMLNLKKKEKVFRRSKLANKLYFYGKRTNLEQIYIYFIFFNNWNLKIMHLITAEKMEMISNILK